MFCQSKFACQQTIAKFHGSADDKPRRFTIRKSFNAKSTGSTKELEVRFVTFALFVVGISSYSLQPDSLQGQFIL